MTDSDAAVLPFRAQISDQIKTAQAANELKCNGLAARQAKGFALGQRVLAPFDVAVRRAFAEPIGLPDMKISPVFPPVFEHHQKLVFDATCWACPRLLFATVWRQKATPPSLQMCASGHP
jgi:hypothetical protein